MSRPKDTWVIYLTDDDVVLLVDALDVWVDRLADENQMAGAAHRKASVNVKRRIKIMRARLAEFLPIPEEKK